MASPATSIETSGWLPGDALAALGFTPGGPETDYGMRWGEEHNVRVSFAPHLDREDGFLYARNAVTGRYLLLARHTTVNQAQAAWEEISARTTSPDGYLAFASLDQPNLPLHPKHARALLWHCLDRELGAYRDIDRAPDGRAHFDATHTLITYRSARVSAENLLHEAIRSDRPGADPVVVRYRIPGRPESTGRLYADDVNAAGREARRLLNLVQRHGLEAQATSVTHGHAAVAASRVPELAFAAVREPASSNAPRLSL